MKIYVKAIRQEAADKNEKAKVLHRKVDDVFCGIFRSVDPISYTEKQVLAGRFHSLVTGVQLEAPIRQELRQLEGAVGFLTDCGKLDEEQEEELWMLMNQIEGEAE